MGGDLVDVVGREWLRWRKCEIGGCVGCRMERFWDGWGSDLSTSAGL